MTRTLSTTASETEKSSDNKNNKQLLDALSAEFPKSEVKSRAGGFGKQLDYISIDTTIGRLNNVLGSDWSVHPVSVDVHTVNGVQYFATVVLQLEALGKSALGVGCDVDKDPDKASKTALAEALKKAGHQFGVGLYLWDEVKRDEIAEYRKYSSATLPQLQQAVLDKSGLGSSVLAEKYGESLKTKEGLLSVLDSLGA